MNNVLRLATFVRSLWGRAAVWTGILLLSVGLGEAAAQGMPFHTPTALPIPLAEQGVRTFYQHLEMRSLLRDGDEIDNPEDLRVGVDAIPFVVPYGLTPRTIMFAGIPYVRKTFEQAGVERSNRGFGDVFLMVKQEILARDLVAGNRRLALFATARFPTGETEGDAGALPPPLRLGSGMVDLTGHVVYSYVNDRVGAHGAVGYSAAAGSEFGVRVGDRFSYDLALGYRLFPAVYQTLKDITLAAYLELNGSVQQAATGGGALLADTGGHTLFVSPGIQLIPLQNWALEASFQYPIVRELRGVQLGPDWSLSVGVRAVFYLFGL